MSYPFNLIKYFIFFLVLGTIVFSCSQGNDPESLVIQHMEYYKSMNLKGIKDQCENAGVNTKLTALMTKLAGLKETNPSAYKLVRILFETIEYTYVKEEDLSDTLRYRVSKSVLDKDKILESAMRKLATENPKAVMEFSKISDPEKQAMEIYKLFSEYINNHDNLPREDDKMLITLVKSTNNQWKVCCSCKVD